MECPFLNLLKFTGSQRRKQFQETTPQSERDTGTVLFPILLLNECAGPTPHRRELLQLEAKRRIAEVEAKSAKKELEKLQKEVQSLKVQLNDALGRPGTPLSVLCVWVCICACLSRLSLISSLSCA